MTYQQAIADALLDIGAVKFTPASPIMFKSGILSPVYVDNRNIPYHPAAWHKIIAGFESAIQAHAITFDIIAGIAVGGVPHSAALAYRMARPSVFVRKEAKAHGTGQQVEGGNVAGKNVLLVEDLVTTGGSSLRGVEALRAAGARVDHALAIISYDMPEAKAAFSSAGVQLHTLTTFPILLQVGSERGIFSPTDQAIIRAWLDDPHAWREDGQ